MWTLDDVPERPLREIDPEGQFSRALPRRDVTLRRRVTFAELLRRMDLSRNTPPLVRAILTRDLRALRAHASPAAIAEARGPEPDPLTPLHLAVLVDEVEAVRALLAAGVDPVESSGSEDTPVLLEGIAHASLPVLDLLLAHTKGPITVRTDSSPAPFWVLHRTARPMEVRTVLDALVAHQVDVRATSEYGETLLHAAAATPLLEAVSWCLGEGFAVDALDARGMTPLMKAVGAHAPRVVERLCAAGADVTLRARGGRTALHYLATLRSDPAVSAGLDETLALLLAAGLPIDSVDSAGLTALHRAAELVDVPTIRALLRQGAGREVRDTRSRRPIDALPPTSASRAETAAIAQAREALG